MLQEEILVRRLCLTGVSSLSHLHDFFRLSESLQASLCCHSAECQCRRCVSDASQMHLTFVSFGRVSLSLTAGLRRHNS